MRSRAGSSPGSTAGRRTVTPARATATINLAAGADVTCTYTNTKLGSITIVKDAVPDAAGLRVHHDRYRPLAVLAGRRRRRARCRTRTTFNDLLPGTYSVTEGVAGWQLTGLDCSTGGVGDTGDPDGDHHPRRGRQRDVHLHEHQAGFDHDHQGRGPRRGPWTSGSPPRAPACRRSAGRRRRPHPAEHHHLHRPAARHLHGDRGCRRGLGAHRPRLLGRRHRRTPSTRIATINLVAGANVTCTYTNTKLGSITIAKDAVPDSAVDFAFTTTGTGLSPF